MAEHNKLGAEGEQIAANYLVDKGYAIRERNWRFGKHELDIIAETDDYLVVVEVKSRSTETWEHPKDAITNSKIRFMVNASEAYVIKYDIDKEVRFDVISTIRKGTDWQIEHIEEAFHSPVI